MALRDAGLVIDYADAIDPAVAHMHVLIARCWQRQIGRQKEEINFQRANEAFITCSAPTSSARWRNGSAI